MTTLAEVKDCRHVYRAELEPGGLVAVLVDGEEVARGPWGRETPWLATVRPVVRRMLEQAVGAVLAREATT